jgi:hypothetical protein
LIKDEIKGDQGRDTTTGRLAYNLEHKRLELNGNLLHYGDRLELRILGYWIPGQIAHDDAGWYLCTHDGVGVRLRSGLTARYNTYTSSDRNIPITEYDHRFQQEGK